MPSKPDPVRAFLDYPEEVPVDHADAGRLAGLTLAVKDIYDVAGYPTGCGNPTRLAESALAGKHAAPVAVLLDAGARFVGKTHTVEFAFGLDGLNQYYGTPINPAAPDRVPGGSSSGSVAAVGAGLADFALGSDTGGSVRGPASFCGLIGLRTTFGRIDIGGTMPLAESLDTVGWFARTPAIYELVGEALLGDDEENQPLDRLIVADDGFARLSGDGEARALAAALARVEVHFPSASRLTLAPDGLDSWREVFRTLQGFEAWRAHKEWIESHDGALSVTVRRRFEVSRSVTQDAYRDAEVKRRAIRRRLQEVLAGDAVLALPTMPTVAPLLSSDDGERESFRTDALALTSPSGLSGFPQISIPLAIHDGAPLGLSLIGPAGRDRALIALARKVLGA